MNWLKELAVRLKKTPNGLITQLFVLTILPLTILLIGVTLWSFSVHQKDMRRLVGERDVRAARAAASAIDEHLVHQLTSVQGLSVTLSMTELSEESIVLEQSVYLKDFDSGLGLVTSSGQLLAYHGDTAYWQAAAIRIGELQLTGSPVILPHPDIPGLLLAIAAVPDRDRLVAGSFSLDQLISHSLTEAFGNSNQTGILLVGSDREALYTQNFAEGESDTTNHPGVLAALDGESGTFYVKMDSSEHVVAYAPIPSLGWGLVVEEPWEKVANPSLSISQLVPLLMVPVLIMAVVSLWFGLRQVVLPLRDLEYRADALAWGNHKSVETPVGGIPEIQNLQARLVHMSQQVQAAQRSLHGYIGEITAAQEEERQRLARELHDDTIQSMIALKQKVQMAELSGNGSDEKTLQELDRMAEQTIQNLRRVTRALRPIYLEDLGLVTALRMLAREVERGAEIEVEFQQTGDERRLPAPVELALYRITQEALNNISRHSQATQASINIQFDLERVRLQVMDNGKGFIVPKTPSAFAPEGHFGLLGLYERASLIGASLEIQSQPGGGTSVVVDLIESPLAEMTNSRKEESMAGTVKDPVCGMEIDPQTAAGKSEYNGQTYYFCSTGCKASFDKDPEKYLHQSQGHIGHH
jgi:signal transduction histidine kinase/YHS domain-containing protein